MTLSKNKPLNKTLSERASTVSNGVAAYSSIVIKRAQNATIWDMEGKEYIDFAGGIGALNTGHSHPKIVAAIQAQASEFTHTSFHVTSYPQYTEVCKKLSVAAPGPGAKKAALFNSGSEAVENAVKFARFYTKRQAIISFGYAFHGRTLLCLTLDGRQKVLKSGFGPFAPGVYRAPFPYPYRPPTGISPNQLANYCLAELERLWSSEISPTETAALIVEPVQGEGGFIVPTPGFLKGLRNLCDRHGVLLIIDEVQSGFGRTGKFWAFEHDEIIPDLIVAGKSLAAGMPLSAVIGSAQIMDSAPAGAIGGTYGGNPLSCAAALAVFDIFNDENILQKAVRVAEITKKRFDSFQENFSIVGESRGLGAMRALELVSDKKTKEPLPAESVKKIVHECENRGLLIIKAGIFDNVLRTLMPLTIQEKELNKGLDILESVLKDFSKGNPIK